MQSFNTGVKFEDGIQITFDDIKDFEEFNKNRKEEDHNIRGYVKSVSCEVVYIDEYKNGSYEWYVLNGKFLNKLEPISWHPLEDYK